MPDDSITVENASAYLRERLEADASALKQKLVAQLDPLLDGTSDAP